MLKAFTFALIALGAGAANAQTIPVTCDNFVQNFNSAPAGAVLTLSGNCGPMTVRNRKEPLTVLAFGGGAGSLSQGATIRGLTLINVANLTWRGGTFRAEEGLTPSSSLKGQALRIQRSSNMEFVSIRVTEAVRGITIGNSQNVRVRRAIFEGLRSDGVDFVDSTGFLLEHSRFRGFQPRPKTCTYADGSVTENISEGKCLQAGGTWKDGDHADIFQTWTNSSDILIRNNDIYAPFPNWSQGITTFGSESVRDMRVLDNRVVTDHANAIVVSKCIEGCLIRGNYVSKASDKAPWAVGIRINGGTAVACGNVVTDPRRPLGTEPC